MTSTCERLCNHRPCQAYKNEGVSSLPFADSSRLGFTAHTLGAFSQRKSPCSVAASVFRRLQNTSLWTDSEAECRDAFCLACSQRRCGESPHVKLQRVSSENHRTQVRGQAVKQSSEIQSALEFFTTSQSCRERSLESVNRVTVIGFSGFPRFLDFSSSEKFKTSPPVSAHPS